MSGGRFLVCVLIALLTLLAACGEDDSVSQEELEQATEEAADEARAEAEEDAELEDLREQVEALRKQDKDDDVEETTTTSNSDSTDQESFEQNGDSGGGVPSDAEDCGAGVYAQAGTTSCPFALNVADTYFSVPGMSFDAFSPTTGDTYSMSCVGGEVITCSGGNGAVVYIKVS